MKLGIIFAILSAQCFAVMGLLISKLAPRIPSSELAFAFGVCGVILLPVGYKIDWRILVGSHWLPLWIRAISGGLALSCYYSNLAIVPVSDALVLANLAPMFVGILSLFFGGRLRLMEWVGLALLVGGVETLRTGSGIPNSALLIGVLGAFLAAVGYIGLSRAVKAIPLPVVVWSFCAAAAILVLPFESANWSFPRGETEWALVAACSLLGVAGQILMSKSFHYLKPAVAAGLSLTSLVWAVAIVAIWRLKGRRFLAAPDTKASDTATKSSGDGTCVYQAQSTLKNPKMILIQIHPRSGMYEFCN